MIVFEIGDTNIIIVIVIDVIVVLIIAIGHGIWNVTATAMLRMQKKETLIVILLQIMS